MIPQILIGSESVWVRWKEPIMSFDNGAGAIKRHRIYKKWLKNEQNKDQINTSKNQPFSNIIEDFSK